MTSSIRSNTPDQAAASGDRNPYPLPNGRRPFRRRGPGVRRASPVLLSYRPLLFLLLFSLLPPAPGLWADPATPACRPPVSSFRIPEKITFCGEDVPLDRLDVRERLEREFYFLLDREGQLLLYIKRAARYYPVVEQILEAHGLPDDLKYVPVAESGLLFRAQSPARAVGYWQFLRGTGNQYGLRVDRYVDDRRCMARSTQAAVAYLRKLYDQFGSWPTALAGYNWGERNVENTIEMQGTRDYYDLYLPEETERYVFRIITLKLILEDPAAYAIQVPENSTYRLPATATVSLYTHHHTPIRVLSTCADTPPRELRQLNPWMLRSELPAGTYIFTLPEGKEADFVPCVTRKQAGTREQVHVVQQGDSLGRIAQRYGVSIGELERWNDISRHNPIHPGQRLLILQRD